MAKKTLKDEITRYLAGNQRQVSIVAACVGASVVMILGAFWLYDLIVAPPVPNLETASPEEVATFMAHRRGLARLPMQERKVRLFEIFRHYTPPERRDALARAFDRMPQSERSQVRDAVFEVAKDQLMQDVDLYRQLSSQRRGSFVEERVKHYDQFRRHLRRRDTGKALVDPFSKGLPTRSDEWMKMVVSRTTADERAKARDYLDHVTEVVERMKKREQRSG